MGTHGLIENEQDNYQFPCLQFFFTLPFLIWLLDLTEQVTQGFKEDATAVLRNSAISI